MVDLEVTQAMCDEFHDEARLTEEVRTSAEAICSSMEMEVLKTSL